MRYTRAFRTSAEGGMSRRLYHRIVPRKDTLLQKPRECFNTQRFIQRANDTVHYDRVKTAKEQNTIG